MPRDFLSLPLELHLEILTLFWTEDLMSFSIVSQATRKLAIRHIFNTVSLAEGDMEQLEGLLNANPDIKNAIRVLSVELSQYAGSKRRKVIQLLSDLPNLSSLTFNHDPSNKNRSYLSELDPLVLATQKAPLRHLHVSLDHKTIADIPTPGPSGLYTCHVDWRAKHDDQESAKPMKYLYSFLEPSLDTLRCLSVLDHDNYRVTRPSTDAPVLDFREIRPPCTQMQKFTYKTAHMDVQTIGIFAEMFPNLISLDISFATYTAFISSAPWTDACLESLSLHRHLTHLKLGIDFETEAGDTLDEDHDLKWYKRCFYRRLEATEKIANVCVLLEACDWTHQCIDSEGNDGHFAFIVVKREDDGSQSRMVRDVIPMRQWWMSRPWEKQYGGGLPDNLMDETRDGYLHVNQFGCTY